MTHHDPCFYVTGGAGAVAIAILLLFAWRKQGRPMRLAERLPVSPAGQVQEGMVQVVGRTSGSLTEKSYFLGLNCHVTQTKIERYQDNQSKSKWITVWDEKHAVPFYVEDASGRIHCDPEKAQYQLLPDLEFTTGERWQPTDSQRTMLSDLRWSEAGIEQRLRDLYFDIERMRHNLPDTPPWMVQAALAGHKKLARALEDPVIYQQALAAGYSINVNEATAELEARQYERLFEVTQTVRKSRLRVTESNILPGDAVHIIGPALNSPPGGNWADAICIRKEYPNDTFLIGEGSPEQVRLALRKEARWSLLAGLGLITVGALMLADCILH